MLHLASETHYSELGDGTVVPDAVGEALGSGTFVITGV